MIWFLRALGFFLGGAVGLFLPPLLFTLVRAQVSYETVMGWWCLTLPVGSLAGAVLGGWFAAKKWPSRSPGGSANR